MAKSLNMPLKTAENVAKPPKDSAKLPEIFVDQVEPTSAQQPTISGKSVKHSQQSTSVNFPEPYDGNLSLIHLLAKHRLENQKSCVQSKESKVSDREEHDRIERDLIW